MRHTERIELTDSFFSAVTKLAEGNPGAVTAIMKMAENSPKIDPQSAFGGFAPLFSLDTLGIYGSHIWGLWKDVCGQDPLKVTTLFRAHQLGMVSAHLIQSAAMTGTHPFDFDSLLGQVKAQLASFDQVPA